MVKLKNFFRSFILLILYVYSTYSVANSQNHSDTVNLDKIATILKDFIKNDDLVIFSQLSPPNPELVNMLFSPLPEEKSSYTQLKSEFLSNQINALKGDPGLRLQANYLENFEPALFEEEDLNFIRRFYISIDWNLLSGGLYENKSKVKQLRQENLINSINHKLEKKEQDYLYLFNYIIYLFNIEKQDLLKQRDFILRNQIKLAEQLFYLREISWEKVLDKKASLADVEVSMKNYSNYNNVLSKYFPQVIINDSISGQDLPILNIIQDSLFRNITNNILWDSLNKLKKTILEEKHKPLKEYTLRPFLRYNMYSLLDNKQKNYASTGLVLSIPLKSNNRSELVNSEMNLVDADHLIQETAARNEMVNHFYEYNFKFKQLTSFYFKKKLIEERIRKEYSNLNLNENDFNPWYLLDKIDERISVEIEISDLKRTMYQKLLKIHTYVDCKSPLRYTEVMNSNEIIKKYSGNNSAILHSEIINNNNIYELISLLQNEEILNIYLLADDIKQLAKTSVFTESFNKNGIKLFPIINAENFYPIMNSINNELDTFRFHGFLFSFTSKGLNPKDSLVIQAIDRLSSKQNGGIVSLKLIFEDGMISQIPKVVLDLSEENILKINSINVKKAINSAYQEINSYPHKTSFCIDVSGFQERYQIENFKNQIINTSEISRFVYDDFLSLLKIENISTSFIGNTKEHADSIINDSGIRYKVQLGVFPYRLSKDYFQKKYMINNMIDELLFEGLYYYTTGNFSKKEEATELKNTLRNKNKHPDAFVVKYIANYRQY